MLEFRLYCDDDDDYPYGEEEKFTDGKRSKNPERLKKGREHTTDNHKGLTR